MKKRMRHPVLVKHLTCLLSIMLGLLITTTAYAQTTVTGVVVNKDGAPVAGATVSVKGKRINTVSGTDGRFSVQANTGDILQVTSVGYDDYEVRIGDDKNITVSLTMKIETLEDLVVVGYGTVRKKDLTGAVSVVNVKDAKKTATYDVAKMLQGQTPGVSVHGSGEPGGFVQIKIRGISSLVNNNPLFVVDGVMIGAPFDISPDDIETIQILKDASATAIYGSRGSTGVVIITTKKGKAGKMRVNYNGYAGIQSIAKKWDLTDAAGYRKITNQAEVNAGLSIAPGNDPTSPSYIGNVNTNWQDEAFRTATIQDHNVSFSGGSEAMTFNASLGYFDQTSTIEGPQSYKRYTATLGVTGKKGIFSYGAKVFYTNSHKVNPFNGSNSKAVFGGALTSLLGTIPTIPVKDPNRLGGYGGADNITQRAITLNVIGLNNLLKNEADRDRFLGNVWGEAEIIKNLKYKLNVSFDRGQETGFAFEPKYDLGWYYLNNTSYLFRRVGTSTTNLIENTLNYRITKGKHTAEALAGYTYQKDKGSHLTGSGINLREPYFYTFDAIAAASDKTLTSGSDASTILSYLGRLSYNYDDRYLVTVNYRRDGSSRFPEANRWGNFQSFSGAWNVHNEKFIELPEIISTLKLRGGYGEVGNQNIGNYLYQSYINTNASYVFNNVLAPGATVVTLVDPGIKWETKTTTNVAVEVGLLNNRLNITAEYFKNTNNDLLAGVPISLSIGSFPWDVTTNAASMENSGIELTIGYRGSINDFTYDITLNGNTLKNKLLSLGLNGVPIYGNASKSEPGRSVGDLYGHTMIGIFQNAADVSGSPSQTNAAPGDVKFQDTDKNNIINDEDRVYLGRAIPNLYYGLNVNLGYKNFDFSMFWQGSAGNKVYNAVYRDLMIEQYSNHHVDALNFWTVNNTSTNIPRPVIGDPNANARASNRFVEDGSYVRLQNFQFGYTLKPMAGLKWLSNTRVYLSGQNVITLTKYKGLDPDFTGVGNDGLFSRGFDQGSFPNPRSFMVGVQLSL
ncbi:MAG: TonB-dependent receptor [Chitinophagaceae bacterium]|nr:TonB-dependent receptor [Chitinophagaceae bacterium]